MGVAPSGKLAGADADTWVAGYRRQARLYAWLFYGMVVVAIGSIIRWELGEFSEVWVKATLFAALLTWLLAYHARRTAETSWVGRVAATSGSAGPGDRGNGEHAKCRIVRFETHRGKRVRVRIPPSLDDYYISGRIYHKLAGMSYPIATGKDDTNGICPACGTYYERNASLCGGCRAPVLDFSHLSTSKFHSVNPRVE
jgi:hypothetical protein